METIASEAVRLAGRLADELMWRGVLTQPRSRDALIEVPRHLFVPRAAWALPDSPNAAGYPIDAEKEPDAWLAAVYSDASIVTQVDDGAGDPASGSGVMSSAVSAPGVVVGFIELLAARPHDRVLEIGTGSGWTAALLSWWCHPGKVTSIEVDGKVAAQAASNLLVAGYGPGLVVGDGAIGWPDSAPYDRVHVTCGVVDVATAISWVEQTRPGGVIVLPWQPGGPLGHKLRLTVTGPETATGKLHGPASYLALRSQRPNTTWNPHNDASADVTVTRTDSSAITDAGLGAAVAIAGLAPGVSWHTSWDEATGGFSLFLYETRSAEGAWAGCYRMPGAEACEVVQYGDRRLWDEVEAAFLRWCSWGRPPQERFGVSLDAEGHRIWLDAPDQVISTVALG